MVAVAVAAAVGVAAVTATPEQIAGEGGRTRTRVESMSRWSNPLRQRHDSFVPALVCCTTINNAETAEIIP